MIKNELESFTYDLKNSIDSYGPFEQYVDPSIRDNLLKQLNETINWIYGEGQNAPTE